MDQALALMEDIECGSPAAHEVSRWRNKLAEGHGRFRDFSAGSIVFPPLFCSLVNQGREKLAEGFGRASAIHERRARYRIEMMRYAALPVSVLAVGLLLGIQLIGTMGPLFQLFDALGR